MNLRNPLKLKKVCSVTVYRHVSYTILQVYHVLTGSSDATSYKRVEIQVAMCGSNAPSDSWTGKLTEVRPINITTYIIIINIPHRIIHLGFIHLA